MSIECTGAANSWFFRNAGLPASTGAFTYTFDFKLTATPTGLDVIMVIRPNPETTGHDLVLNDPADSQPNRLNLQVNWATTQAKSPDQMPINVWMKGAIVGSSANIYLKYRDPDDGSLVSVLAAQTVFTPARERWGDAGSNTNNAAIRYSRIRGWNAALTDAGIIAEWDSPTVVRTANLHTNVPGTGGNITAALTAATGTSFTNSGAVIYSSDEPSYTTWNGVLVSGTVRMPSEVPASPATERWNFVRFMGDFSQLPWDTAGHTVSAPAASNPGGMPANVLRRLTTTNSTRGVSQLINALPVTRMSLSTAARYVDADYFMLRHMSGDRISGAQGTFNLRTGDWTAQQSFGTATSVAYGKEQLADGYWRFWICVDMPNVGSRSIEFWPATVSGGAVASGRSVEAGAFQLEEMAGTRNLATYPKYTTTDPVQRLLTAVQLVIPTNTTVPVGGTANITVSLADNAGDPFGYYGPVSLSYDASKVSVPDLTAVESTINGTIVVPVSGLATGTVSMTATAGGITSAAALLTVGGLSSRLVEILVQPGTHQGTTGWTVGVYARHATDKFPTSRLFEARNQLIEQATVNGQARLQVPVPTGVSVSPGQEVIVGLSNENISGVPVDGPSVFSAVVV